MVDYLSFQNLVASLKAVGDLAKSLKSLKATTEVTTKISEIQDLMMTAQASALAAQAEQLTMIQHIRNLEEEIAHIKAWEMEKQRYQLISPWDGCHVYALKESSKGSEPQHWICTQCYEDGRKSILHNAQRHERRIFHTIKCPRCKLEMDIHGSGDTERQYVTA